MNSGDKVRLPDIFWPVIACTLPVFYAAYYAPYGINDSDGGFLTGLAWHLQCGEALYRDVIYVRPPLPVWGRWLELQLLPENLAVIGERCIFYLKVWIYSLLGAGLLAQKTDRWVLTALGFVVSVHCYPPAAWHTIDGILLATAGFAALWRWPFVGSALIGGALLCKQSFYPLALLWCCALQPLGQLTGFSSPGKRSVLVENAVKIAGFALPFLLVYSAVDVCAMWPLIAGSAQGGQAWQFGVVKYFSINPVTAIGAAGLIPVIWHYSTGKDRVWALLGWYFFLGWLIVRYIYAIWSTTEFTLPFAQTRLLFGVAVLYWLWRARRDRAVLAQGAAALAIAWTASISWGYALPILFSTPMVWAALSISRDLQPRAPRWFNFIMLLILLGVFRYAYECVYQNGRRVYMTAHLGDIFPALRYIYSTPITAARYSELRDLVQKYPNFKTLPTFTAAHYLTRRTPTLPLDWVARREYNADEAPLLRADSLNRPVYFLGQYSEKQLLNDPELIFTRQIMETREKIETRAFFDVYR